jgi:uncharacterized membrane protein HdeD (DUF308 family)
MTAMTRPKQLEPRFGAPWLVGEGMILMFLGLAAALLPRVADLGAQAVLGWSLIASGLIGAASLIGSREQVPPAARAASLIAALLAGGAALLPLAIAPGALAAGLAGFLTVDAAALVATTWRLRRRDAAGWGWLAGLAGFELLLGGWLFGLQAQLGPAAVGHAAAARFIIGGMALVGFAAVAIEAP